MEGFKMPSNINPESDLGKAVTRLKETLDKRKVRKAKVKQAPSWEPWKNQSIIRDAYKHAAQIDPHEKDDDAEEGQER